MFRRLLIVLALCAGFLQGCATSSIPDLPETLDNKGLLVARLYMPGSQLWENAQINIDGRLYGANLRDGYIAIALEPGQHNFIQLRIQGQHLLSYQSDESAYRKVRGGGGGYYYYSPGGSYTIYYTTLAVNRGFTIETGKITNLGLTVYLSVPEDPNKKRATVNQSKEYYTFPLDNSAEMSYYLETNYPALMATLKDRAPKLAPGNYVDTKKLPDLRRFIASHELNNRRYVETANATAIYGDAGTIVVLPNSKSAASKKFEVLDTGTLANIVDARSTGDQMLFLTSDAKLLTYAQGKLATSALPYRIHPIRLSPVGDNKLFIVDNRMNVLISQDHGGTWTKYDAGTLSKPRSDVGIVSDGAGAYVYLGRQGLPTAFIYFPPGNDAPKVMDPPQYRGGISTTSYNSVIARESGVFVVFKEMDFYFRGRGRDQWELRSKPAQECGGIRFDTAGRDLQIECKGTAYESKNGGKTWKKAGEA